jgi:retron-type reverse transcriptase
MSFKYDFTRLKSEDHLLHVLGVDRESFARVLAFDPEAETISEPDENGVTTVGIGDFIKHKIPKKNPRRGYRLVWEPTFLKSTYKALGRQLGDFFSYVMDGFPHVRTFGYIGGRNIRENARDHCGHKHLISIDLRDFFPSIKQARIESFLSSTGITPPVAASLSRFVTIGGSLPLGLPTSPTIANAICFPMDRDLERLAQTHAATFSRYADDISFSSNESLPLLADIETCVQQHGFTIAESKTRKSRLGQAHFVTGLSISDPAQPHVPRRKKRRLRQELHFAKKYGLESHFEALGIDPQYFQQEVNRLDGLVKFTAYHEPRQSAYLKTTWAEVLRADGFRPSFEPKSQLGIPFYIYVDESEFVGPDGARLLALAMAVSQHQDRIDEATEEVLETYLSDIFADGNPQAIEARGVHFADATQDLKLAYVDRMRALPFEGYVAMARMPDATAYESIYLRLLTSMITRRLMAAESQFAYLVFEENDKVSQSAVRKVVNDAYKSLQSSNNRHPQYCHVEFAGKPNLGLSVPDFLLGLLGKYLTIVPEPKDRPPVRERLLFERIRDKYRLILDVDQRIEYSRRRPVIPWREMTLQIGR